MHSRSIKKYSHLFFLAVSLCLSTACKNNFDASTNPACFDCHGETGKNSAPPVDTSGNSSTTSRGVGAHQAHLVTGPYRVALQCADCHLVPTAVDSVGHNDTSLPAEVTFGELAKLRGQNPLWDGTKCSDVYCHGSALSGGTNQTPIWTKVDGTQAVCGSCHGLPPDPPHPAQSDCVSCHADVVNASKQIINKALHINGEVDVSNDTEDCHSCHGSSSNNAPPVDTTGHTTTSSRGVGAHQTHMNTNISANVSCVECHLVPSQITDPGHNDTALPAEVTFGSLAKTGGLTPVWNGISCSNVYCHGKFTGGSSVNPIWTQVDGTQAACGKCHGRPPSTGHHQIGGHTGLSCSSCHGEDYSSTTVRVVDHINGRKDVGGPGSNIQSWSATTKACTPTCHGKKTW